MKKQNKAFTLVELIVVITILAILGTIAFLSYQGYSKSARDSRRISDINNLKTSLALFQTKTGKYPIPDFPEDVTYSGAVVWSQGVISEGVFKNLTNINKKPIDPLTDSEYTYSLLNTKKEFQIGGILEGGKTTYINISNETYAAGSITAEAYITGDYNGLVAQVSTGSLTYVLAVPSIISSVAGDLQEIIVNSTLIYDGFSNLPSSYSGTTVNINGESGLTLTNNLVVYSGTLDSLKNPVDQNILVTNLQTAYTGTELSNVGEIKNILSVNTSSPTAVTNLVADMTNNNVGGLPNLGLKSLATSESTSVPTLSTDLYSLTDGELKNIFAAGSSYVENWTTNNCNSATTAIVNVTDSASFNASMNGKTLANNTIYKVANGTYDVTNLITLGTCSAVIGQSKDGVIFKRKYDDLDVNGLFYKENEELTINNIILYGFNVDGNKSTYTASNVGIYLSNSSNNTFNDIESYDNNNLGIFLSSSNNTFNNISSHNNSNGIYIFSSSSNFNNIESYNNSYDGIYFNSASNNTLNNVHSYNNTHAGIWMIFASSNNFDNTQSNNNGQFGIRMQSSDNTFDNTQSYSNGSYGFRLQYAERNSFTNTETYSNAVGFQMNDHSKTNNLNNIKTYNNSSKGISMEIYCSNNILNNVQSYNNGTYGIYVYNYSSNNTLNNAQSYNNNNFGIYLYNNSSNNILNNIQNYNNKASGTWLESSSNNIFNNVQSYDNVANGIVTSSSTGNKYYGVMKIFGNDANTNSLTVGSDGYLGFSNGTTTSSTMDCTYHSQPNLIASWGVCGSTIRGKQVATTIPVTNYTYGLNILTQIQPVIWNATGSVFELYGTNGVDYDTSKKIGEW